MNKIHTHIDSQSLRLGYFDNVLPLHRSQFKECAKNPVLVVSTDNRPSLEIKVSQIERISFYSVIDYKAVGKVAASSLP